MIAVAETAFATIGAGNEADRDGIGDGNVNTGSVCSAEGGMQGGIWPDRKNGWSIMLATDGRVSGLVLSSA